MYKEKERLIHLGRKMAELAVEVEAEAEVDVEVEAKVEADPEVESICTK
jgi:uncharacterized protein YciI